MSSTGTETSQPTWPAVLRTLTAGTDLTAAETDWAMDTIMSGQASEAQIAAFAVGLRAKGETPDELEGMVEAMLAHANRLTVTHQAVDVVGTGGDGSGSVNISTMAALVVAAAGIPVVKHGNRAASSKCGTADVLAELGVRVDLEPQHVASCVQKLGIGFCLAPVFHPAMRHVGPTRRQIGIPTAFNLLGPLTNPALPAAGLIGCADPAMAPIMAAVFARRGASALVVSAEDGLDELTTTAANRVWVVRNGDVHELRLAPEDVGLSRRSLAELRGGDATHNATVVHDLLAGKPGPVRDTVLLNAAGACVAFDALNSPKASSQAPSPESLATEFHTGLERAAQAVDSGAAAELLQNWAQFTREF